MVVVRGKGSSGDGQKRKVAIVRAAISFPVLVCFKEVGNRLMAGLLWVCEVRQVIFLCGRIIGGRVRCPRTSSWSSDRNQLVVQLVIDSIVSR